MHRTVRRDKHRPVTTNPATCPETSQNLSRLTLVPEKGKSSSKRWRRIPGVGVAMCVDIADLDPASFLPTWSWLRRILCASGRLLSKPFSFAAVPVFAHPLTVVKDSAQHQQPQRQHQRHSTDTTPRHARVLLRGSI